MKSNYISLKEIAEDIGVTKDTVKRNYIQWRDQYNLEVIRLPGGAIRIKRDDYSRMKKNWRL